MITANIDWSTPKGVQNLKTEVYKRNGYMAPKTLLVHYEGKRLVPYVYKKLGLKLNFSGALKLTYTDELLEKMLQDSMQLMQKMPPQPFFGNGISSFLGAAILSPKKD